MSMQGACKSWDCLYPYINVKLGHKNRLTFIKLDILIVVEKKASSEEKCKRNAKAIYFYCIMRPLVLAGLPTSGSSECPTFILEDVKTFSKRPPDR